MALDESRNAICDLSSLDATSVLLLNNTNAKETSVLDDSRLKTLLDMAFYARGIDRGATAFLLALEDSATYVIQTSCGSRRLASRLSTLIASSFRFPPAARGLPEFSTKIFLLLQNEAGMSEWSVRLISNRQTPYQKSSMWQWASMR